MKCEKCAGRGFIEFEHGLIQVQCDECGGTGKIDDSNIGTESDNSNLGGTDTGLTQQPKKPKAKRKAAKRHGKVL